MSRRVLVVGLIGRSHADPIGNIERDRGFRERRRRQAMRPEEPRTLREASDAIFFKNKSQNQGKIIGERALG